MTELLMINLKPDILIIGGGPAGLMSAFVLSEFKCNILLVDAMPSLGRKFLMAGRSGLNITTKKNIFFQYGNSSDWLYPILKNFSPEDIIKFCENLGHKTFTGTSDRVFPTQMKASPLLRSWIKILIQNNVQIKTSCRWLGIENSKDSLDSTTKTHRLFIDRTEVSVTSRSTILAMGGASWKKLGSDGSWVKILEKHLSKASQIVPFSPSNVGLKVIWSSFMDSYFGQPVKPVSITNEGKTIKGEFIISRRGLEGGIIYHVTTMAERKIKMLKIDLLPDLSLERVTEKLSNDRGRNTVSNFLRKVLKLPPVKLALLNEFCNHSHFDKTELAYKIKNLTIIIDKNYPMDQAISTSGGISKYSFDKDLMLKDLPGVFCAGEMLD